MSRYVHVAAPALKNVDEVAQGLATLGLTVHRGRGRVMLDGSVECPGEPVDLRLAAGTLDAVEDFGFVDADGGVRLVCGELDRALLDERLLGPLRATVAEQRVRQAAADAGLEVVEQAAELDGRRRLILRRR